jgi:hypothetical protein
MVKISDMDNYLHADAVEDGDVIEIVGKPHYVSADESTFDRAYLEIIVKLPNGRQKTWTPNKTTLKKLAATFGDDADLWNGKRVQLKVLEQNVRGEMKGVIYGEPAKDLPKQELLSK